MTKKMERAMKRGGAYLDAIYYCLHHPQAVNPAYKRRCPCRKPNPGLLKRGAEELKIDLKSSFLVGDGIPDIQAGRRAGCRTILIGNWKCDLCKLMQAKKLKPDYIASDILDAIRFIEKNLRTGS